MPTDIEKFKNHVHILDLVDGKIPDFDVNPDLVHRLASTDTHAHDGTEIGPTYRYFVALRGKGRLAASHRFHDRVLRYPSGEGNGIFALYKNHKGAITQILDIHRKPVASVERNELAYSLKDEARIAKASELLKDCSVVVIRGSFKDPEAFIKALTEAQGHELTREPLQTHALLGPHELAHIGSVVAKSVSKGIKRYAPNIPPFAQAARLTRQAGNFLDEYAHRVHPVKVAPPYRGPRQR